MAIGNGRIACPTAPPVLPATPIEGFVEHSSDAQQEDEEGEEECGYLAQHPLFEQAVGAKEAPIVTPLSSHVSPRYSLISFPHLLDPIAPRRHPHACVLRRQVSQKKNTHTLDCAFLTSPPFPFPAHFSQGPLSRFPLTSPKPPLPVSRSLLPTPPFPFHAHFSQAPLSRFPTCSAHAHAPLPSSHPTSGYT